MRLLNSALRFAGLAVAMTTSYLSASPVPPNCAAGSYANYVSNYPDEETSCMIGDLSYKRFRIFKDYTTGGGSLTAADFLLTPNLTTGGFDISIQGGDYNNEYYYLRYIVDPAPILGGEELSFDFGISDFSARQSFSLFSVPDVQVSKWVCPQGLFGQEPDVSQPLTVDSVDCGSAPPDVPAFLQVGPGETDSVTFVRPVVFTQVGILFFLNGTVPDITVRTYPQVIDLNQVPEPSSMALLGGGLVALAAFRRRKL